MRRSGHSCIATRISSSGLLIIGKIPHFIFDFTTKVQSAPRRRKHHSQSRTWQHSKTACSFRFPRRSWPQPKGCGGYRSDNGDTVRRSGQESSIRLRRDKETTRHTSRDSTNWYNFVKRNIDFNVPNPETQCSVGRDIDWSDEIIPKPSQKNQICNTDPYNCAVCSNGDCCNH